MSAHFKIVKALLDSVTDLNLPYPMSLPNRELSDSEKGDVWLNAKVVNAASNMATLGDKGEDNHVGFLQIDINVLRNTGEGLLLTLADTILTQYPAGKALLFQGQTVNILQSPLSPLRYDGGYAKRTISINYYTRTVRRP